ncbi:hypothetical protein [Rufibacter hautae]|uniref:Uncharacterized protein n=1 Tax=Rufibacter hautae TaxID=2595005 RepID=A0A5B6TAF1_9BACT|nr:hypothetical protein [Rufibacter hautae]KAA3435931.1 hypothetical protein FOA19_23085 [Rufibacter hautae]
MLIYLQDLDTEEELAVDLTVESTVPCQDLFVLFSTRHQASRLVPTPHQEYQWQKVSHLTVGSLSHGGQRYTLTLGFYLRDGRLVPLVLDQACADQGRYGNRFGTAQEYYDHSHGGQVLFHYPEVPSLLHAGEKPLSFPQAVAKALQRGAGENKAYALGRDKGFTAENLISEKEFQDRQATVPEA